MSISKNNKEQAARFIDVEHNDGFWGSTWMMGINHIDLKMLVSNSDWILSWWVKNFLTASWLCVYVLGHICCALSISWHKRNGVALLYVLL